MNPNVESGFVYLLGKPLGQSFAARMQNAAYRAMGWNLLYAYAEVENDNLQAVVEGLRYLPGPGFAVTKPNKVKVLEYLDGLDPLCQKMGACNTVAKQNGKLIGYNTDGMGFYISLTQESGVEVKGQTFFCFGAGGAGRAMCSVLAYYGAAKILISDYIAASAEALAEDINTNFAPVAQTVPYGDFSRISECGVIMNASGIGMAPHLHESPMPKGLLRPDQICFDACYNPEMTQFLLDAQEAGCKAFNGLGMSLYQGVAQIELWTGQTAPVDVMRDELMEIMREKEDGTYRQ